MSQNISRRSAIGGMAAVVAAPAVSAASPDTPVNALWERRQDHVKIACQLRVEYDAAMAALPAWARPGPRQIDSNGNYCGEDCGWPLDETVTASSREGSYRVCRLSPYDITKLFEMNAVVAGRHAARAAMRAQYRRIIPLIRAQRAERERVGIDQIEAATESNYETMNAIEDAIEGLPVSSEATAARILLVSVRDCSFAACIETDATMHVAAIALDPLRSSLSGLLLEHVEFFLADQSRPYSQMPFWGM